MSTEEVAQTEGVDSNEELLNSKSFEELIPEQKQTSANSSVIIEDAPEDDEDEDEEEEEEEVEVVAQVPVTQTEESTSIPEPQPDSQPETQQPEPQPDSQPTQHESQQQSEIQTEEQTEEQKEEQAEEQAEVQTEVPSQQTEVPAQQSEEPAQTEAAELQQQEEALSSEPIVVTEVEVVQTEIVQEGGVSIKEEVVVEQITVESAQGPQVVEAVQRTVVIEEDKVLPEPPVEEDPKILAERFKTLGNTAFATHKYQEAVECYTAAIELYTDPIYFSNRAAAFIHSKQYMFALADCETALNLKPDWGKAHARRGTVLARLDRLEEARVALTQALQYEPDNKPAKEELASVDRILEQRIRAAAEAEARLEELQAQQAAEEAQAAAAAAAAAASGSSGVAREAKKRTAKSTQKTATKEKKSTKTAQLQIAKAGPGWLFGLFGIATVAAFGLIRFFKPRFT